MKLLTNNTFVTKTNNWFAPTKELKEKYKSVIDTELMDMTSSAGDWSGFILQQTGKNQQIIRCGIPALLYWKVVFAGSFSLYCHDSFNAGLFCYSVQYQKSCSKFFYESDNHVWRLCAVYNDGTVLSRNSATLVHLHFDRQGRNDVGKDKNLGAVNEFDSQKSVCGIRTGSPRILSEYCRSQSGNTSPQLCA